MAERMIENEMRKRTLTWTAATAVLALSTTALSTTASSEPVCGPRSLFLSKLGERYSESPSAIGLAANGKVLEVLSSKSGSWSIITTGPDGETCLLASGESWETLPQADNGPAA